MSAENEIDSLTAGFYAAFDNRHGRTADVGSLRRMLLPEAVVVCTRPFTTYSVESFVEPRRRLLTEGRLVDFWEWETSARTEISGDVACRIGTYAKAGFFDGEVYEGTGHKTFQFVLTGQGWRIAAFSWWDD